MKNTHVLSIFLDTWKFRIDMLADELIWKGLFSFPKTAPSWHILQRRWTMCFLMWRAVEQENHPSPEASYMGLLISYMSILPHLIRKKFLFWNSFSFSVYTYLQFCSSIYGLFVMEERKFWLIISDIHLMVCHFSSICSLLSIML